jgi:hypothetical protein
MGSSPGAGRVRRIYADYRARSTPRQQEAVVTNPREQGEARAAATAHTEAEAIDDLDVTGDDAGDVGGGLGSFSYTQVEVKYTNK